jgi:hypothetical protein
MRWLTALSAIVLLGCSSSMTAPSSTQVWQFTATPPGGATTATVSCTSAGSCTTGVWTLATQASDGCTLDVTFTVAFSSTNSVVLSNFGRSTETTCTGLTLPRGDAAGTGTTDMPYPNAHSAEGSVKVPFVGIFYVITGPPSYPWQAHRVS